MAKQSLRERLQQKQKDLKSRGSGGNMIFFKEGKTRFRALSVGADNDWGFEVIYIYLGKELGGFISPKTIGKKCAAVELHEQMKSSKKEEDKAFAKKFQPKKRFVVLSIKYKDEDGKEVDEEIGERLALVPNGAYNEMIDIFLDKEGGDFTDPVNGFDLKMNRTGKTMTDTEYHVINCKPTKLPKKYRGEYNLEEYVKAVIPTYKETEELMEKFLNVSPADDDDREDKPIKKKKKKIKSDL